MTEKPYRGVFHFDYATGEVVDGPAPVRPPEKRRVKRGSSDGGIAFQMPPGYLKETGKYEYIKGGPFDGRLRFRNRQEARDIAARHEDACGMRTRYDPH